MSSSNRGGLVPVRSLNGRHDPITNRYKKTTEGDDTALIYVGDPLALNADGTVRALKAADTTAAAANYIGVAARIFINQDGRSRVHGLPDQHPNISVTADADWIDVYDDPDQVFAARTSTSAGMSEVGNTTNITTTARVTAAGISGVQLDLSTSAAIAQNPFRIVRVSTDNLENGELGDAEGRVEVIANNHVFRSTGAV